MLDVFRLCYNLIWIFHFFPPSLSIFELFTVKIEIFSNAFQILFFHLFSHFSCVCVFSFFELVNSEFSISKDSLSSLCFILILHCFINTYFQKLKLYFSHKYIYFILVDILTLSSRWLRFSFSQQIKSLHFKIKLKSFHSSSLFECVEEW